jgi:zinc protease
MRCTRYFTRASVVFGALVVLALPQAGAAETAVSKAKAAKPAKTLLAAPVKVTSVEGITEYRLGNGLRVLLAPDASKPTTTVNVTYLVGSRHENYGETGMAHLLEHLVFKGTKNRGNIMAELGKRGMQFNGTTFFDRTNYFETFPASDENLKWALEMEADRMVNSLIAKADLETEFSVVRNEMERGENNPVQVLWKQLSAATFDWHNYGKTTIGARADVENVRIENLQAFYRKYYQPDNAVLLVAGKFDPEATLALINQQFGVIPKPARELPPTYTTEAPRDGAREVTVRRVADQYLMAALYPIAAASHPDVVAVDLLGDILAGTPNGRLHKALVEQQKAVGSFNWTLGLAEPGYTVFWLQLNKEHARDEARRIMLEVIEGIKAQPITEAELKRAKNAALSNFEKTLNDPQRFAVAMSEDIAIGDWRMFFISNRDRVEAITLAQIQAVAENYFKESNRSLGHFIPTEKVDRAVIPPSPEVAKLVADYKGRTATASGESFDASPLNIEARTQRASLSNGAKLALLPKKTRGETVRGAFNLHFGDEKSLFGQRVAADLTADMLLRGAGKLTRAEIADRLDEIKAKLSIAESGSNVSVRFEVSRPHLNDLLDLVREVLRTPTFPAAEFDRLVKENLTQIDAMRKEPGALAGMALGRALNVFPKGDIRYQSSLEESEADYRAATLEQVRAFHARFYGANHAQFSLVGDFDAAEITARLERDYGTWNSQAAYTRVPAVMPKPLAPPQTIEVTDKPNAVLIGRASFELLDSDPDYAAMLAANEILGGGTKSRIWDRLRQKDGISYGAGSGFFAGAEDKVGGLSLNATFAPQFLARAQAALAEELARFVKDGITAEELADAKKALQQERSVARAQDAALAATLASQARIGRTMKFSAETDARIAALTLDQVNAALRKYVRPETISYVYAGDFAGAAKQAVK